MIAVAHAPPERSAGLSGVCYTVHTMATMHYRTDLGEAVRAARSRAGLTQAGLAAACALSRQTIAQLESGTFSDLGIRKVERVLARLGLRLRVEPVGAVYAGTRGGSRLARLLRARAEERRQTALHLAAATLRKLSKAGVSARIVGSLASDKFRVDSDVDYLIEERGGLAESRITGLIEASMGGFPFDVIFAERTDPKLLKFIRDEVRSGASVVRTA